MDNITLACVVFITTYSINLIYISIFYHRGLAHGSIILTPRLKRWVVMTGPWFIGLDAAAWTCMHRNHHQYADQEKDPHSPHNGGLFSVFISQLVSYKKALVGLSLEHKNDSTQIADLDIQVHWLYKNNLSLAPYLLHMLVAISIAFTLDSMLIGAAYFIGLQSHPIQGWLVNALGHSKGYRNFDTQDKSVNNIWLGYLVFGEGYQNNHHEQPHNANFSHNWWELDLGYFLCHIFAKTGLVSFPK